MSTPQEYAQQRAAKFQEILRQRGYPLARVTHDWNLDSFYRFTVELHDERILRIEFDAQDVAAMGTSDEKWTSKFRHKLESALTRKKRTRLDVTEISSSGRSGEAFFLDIPFYRSRYSQPRAECLCTGRVYGEIPESED